VHRLGGRFSRHAGQSRRARCHEFAGTGRRVNAATTTTGGHGCDQGLNRGPRSTWSQGVAIPSNSGPHCPGPLHGKDRQQACPYQTRPTPPLAAGHRPARGRRALITTLSCAAGTSAARRLGPRRQASTTTSPFPVLMGSTGAFGLPGVLAYSVAGTENKRRRRPATEASTRPSDTPGWPRRPGRH
jgi:hypothetical protein